MTCAETKILNKPKVRNAEIADFEKVYPLLRELNNTRMTKDDWLRLFQNHWNIEEFSAGVVLELEEKIVGYIGTIYSRQIIAGQAQLFCNLTSWIVEDEYRSHSIMLLLPLLRNKNAVLTSYSSNDVTYEVYKKLGFKEGNMSKRIIYPFPSLRANKFQIITDIEDIKTSIKDEFKAVFNDHCIFGNTCILILSGEEQCLLMGVNRKNQLRIYYASDREFLQNHLSGFRGKLMSMFKAKKMLVNDNLLAGHKIFLSRKVTWGYAYQYKTNNQDCIDPLPVYSELFVLNM